MIMENEFGSTYPNLSSSPQRKVLRTYDFESII